MKKISSVVIGLLVCFFASAQTIPSWKINDVTDYYGKKNDSVYVINFWATYCKPCIGEIPYLQTIAQKYEKLKVKLLLVSLDIPSFYPRKIEKFAKKNNYTADIVWLNESDVNVFCPPVSKSWMGTMPATIFVNPASGYKKFVGAAMSEAIFEKELRLAIGRE